MSLFWKESVISFLTPSHPSSSFFFLPFWLSSLTCPSSIHPSAHQRWAKIFLSCFCFLSTACGERDTARLKLTSYYNLPSRGCLCHGRLTVTGKSRSWDYSKSHRDSQTLTQTVTSARRQWADTWNAVLELSLSPPNIVMWRGERGEIELSSANSSIQMLQDEKRWGR